MKLFEKLKHGAGVLFNKLTNDPTVFNKIVQGARKADNTISRVGHLASNVAEHFNRPDLARAINQGVNTSNQLRNNLEKAVELDMNDINSNNAHNHLQYA